MSKHISNNRYQEPPPRGPTHNTAGIQRMHVFSLRLTDRQAKCLRQIRVNTGENMQQSIRWAIDKYLLEKGFQIDQYAGQHPDAPLADAPPPIRAVPTKDVA